MARKKTLGRRVLEWLAIVVGGLLLRALMRSWRLELRNWQAIESAARRGEKVVYAFWHNRMLGFVRSHRGRGVCVMVSRHGDGEIIARIVEGLGFTTVRGSTTRGGPGALRALVERAKTADAAVTPDGPKGPRYRLQAGVVLLASLTGRKVVYGSYSASRAWRFGSWDRFIVPKPFARVVIQIAEETVTVPPDLAPPALEEARRDLERRLARVTADLDREITGEVDPLLAEAAGSARLVSAPDEKQPRAPSS